MDRPLPPFPVTDGSYRLDEAGVSWMKPPADASKPEPDPVRAKAKATDNPAPLSNG